MEKLSMCRICLAENVRMCVVTNKGLQEMYEKLTDVSFVTEDRKPMLACLFCCTRLKQCCQLQRQCVQAEELLAQMLSEDYEFQHKPLANREHLEFVGGFIITSTENISIVDDCQVEGDGIKQELPVVCEEQDDSKLPSHQSKELEPGNLYKNYQDVEAHHTESESEEEQLVMEIKTEEEELSENLRVREVEKLELVNPDKSNPGVGDIPAHDSELHSEDDAPLMEMKTGVEEGQGVSKRRQRVCVTRRAAVAKKPTLKRKLEDTIPARQTMNVLSDSKIIQTIKTSTSKSVAKIKEPVTTTPQSSLSQSSNLIQHTQIDSVENPFTCRICQRGFSHKYILNKHFRKHTGEKPYKCDICQRSFRYKKNLKVHIRNHSGKKPFKCEVCQRSFSHKGSLNVHSRQHTGEKPYQCDVCQRSFVRKNRLNVHSRQHYGEKPFKCDICQRSLSDKSSLKEHFRIHTGEKPYKCDVCLRSFISKSKLNVHFRKHSGEKPFQCDICQSSFSDKSTLNKHVRKHTGEKPYKCDVCQRSFSENGSLTIHSRLHTGEKPYQCSVCQRNFVCKGKLTVHFRKHSSEKPFMCDICQCSFNSKRSLKVHSRIHLKM